MLSLEPLDSRTMAETSYDKQWRWKKASLKKVRCKRARAFDSSFQRDSAWNGLFPGLGRALEEGIKAMGAVAAEMWSSFCVW